MSGVVMSVHRMSAAGGFRYLLRNTASADVARGQESLVDYYANSGNPPGRWIGAGLDGLADGRGVPVGTLVSEAAMTAVFGRAADPVTGAGLGRAFPTKTGPDGVRRPAGVAGYDLTFTPVKSVSVLWALGDTATRAAVEAAHHAAVGQTLVILESRVAATRLGYGGHSRVPVRGVVAAEFDHPDTRHGDPNLHTHVVVANRVQAADGVWRTLDGQQLFAAGVALSETYDALVADELTRRLPVGFGWRDRGARRTPGFEVDGIDDQLLALFSTRSRDVTTHLQSLLVDFHVEHGRGPSRVETIRLRQTATLATRPAKTAHAWSDLLTSWAQRARVATGREPRDLLAAALDGSYARPLRAVDVGPESRRDLAALAVIGVAERRSTWNGWNLEAEIARLTKAIPMASATDRATLHATLLVAATSQCVALDTVDAVGDGPMTGRDRRSDSASRGVRAVSRSVANDSVHMSRPVAGGSVSVTAPVASATVQVSGTDAMSVTPTPDPTDVVVSPDWDVMARRYTSAAMLDAETRLLDAATRGAGPALTPRFVERVVSALTSRRALDPAWAGRGFTHLSPDQAAAVAQVCTAGRSVQVLVGPAGTGKTTTLKAIARLWALDPARQAPERSPVVGLAPSATAAAQLSQALGIRCETTAKWLHETTGPGGRQRAALLTDLSRRDPTASRESRLGRDQARYRLAREQSHWTLKPGQLLIVDEATLAGTRELDQLVTQARQVGAGVLLVGDHHQLSAVQAGGAFGLLARRTTTAELTGLWRFTHRWEAETTRLLRHGDPAAIDAYAAHGRIHDGGYDTVLTDALTAWRADTDAGLDSLLIAADNDTVRDLNTRIRTDNIATGRATVAGVDLWDGTTAGIGDRITTRHNDRSLRLPDGDHVRNGETWTITALHPDGSLDARTTRPLENGQTPSRRLPADYVTEHVELGYATTAHRAQSRTVDTARVVVGDGMSREHLYVAMTRGRSANHAYVPLDAAGDVDEAHQQLTSRDRTVSGKEALAHILERTGAETSATESMQGHADPRRRAGVPRRPQIPANELQYDHRSARNGPARTR